MFTARGVTKDREKIVEKQQKNFLRDNVNCARQYELYAALWIVRGIVRSQLCEEVMSQL